MLYHTATSVGPIVFEPETPNIMSTADSVSAKSTTDSASDAAPAWRIDRLVVGDGAAGIETVKTSRRTHTTTPVTLEKNTLYAASGSRGPVQQFWPIEQEGLCLFENQEACGIVSFQVKPVTTKASDAQQAAESAVPSEAVCSKGIAYVNKSGNMYVLALDVTNIRKSKRTGTDDVLNREVLVWLRANAGWAVVVGGPGSRMPSKSSEDFHIQLPTVVPNSEGLLDMTCPRRRPGRCLPASVAMASILFLRQEGVPVLQPLIDHIFEYFSSSYVRGSPLSQLSPFVMGLIQSVQEAEDVQHHLQVGGGEVFPLPQKREMTSMRVRQPQVESFLRSCEELGKPPGLGKRTSQVLTHVEPSPSSNRHGLQSRKFRKGPSRKRDDDSVPGKILVIRLVSKGVDHAIVADLRERVIYDSQEPHPMRLCIGTLGICAGMGPFVRPDVLRSHVSEVRAIVDQNVATSRKYYKS